MPSSQRGQPRSTISASPAISPHWAGQSCPLSVSLIQGRSVRQTAGRLASFPRRCMQQPRCQLSGCGSACSSTIPAPDTTVLQHLDAVLTVRRSTAPTFQNHTASSSPQRRTEHSRVSNPGRPTSVRTSHNYAGVNNAIYQVDDSVAVAVFQGSQ
jgi:hypothetical protein